MAADSGQLTVLIIDDEPNARKVIKLLLERENYRVITAANGEEGLILAKVERPGIILLDLMMPKMNGHETLKRLKEDQDTNEIPVIVVSAKVGENDIATSFKLGALFHVEKPYETRDLLQKLKVAMSRGGGADEEAAGG